MSAAGASSWARSWESWEKHLFLEVPDSSEAAAAVGVLDETA